ncbi:hypothetical protein CSUB01_01348 [Colletotrichum sublineola]|uniref:DUF7708 domain-containing protein n=1 Tax=Colletotrichum sublineola TaxID=1173701 RepID=A0A066XE29_COLSU|nr:hypothetical protein CSUB01_01348 [Colletotrichum sublineola]
MAFVDPTPGALVEQYSWDIANLSRDETLDTEECSQARSEFINERERIERARKEEIQRIEAQLSFSKPGDIVAFKRAERELRQVMQSFQALVPNHLSEATSPRSWDDVMQAVTTVQAQWDSKYIDSNIERAKERVRKMCNGLNNHSTALKMLPSETEWVSVIAGTVSMVVKASANHIRVTESFAMGIIAINDAVNLVQRGHVYETPVIQQLTMRLYCYVFTYLCKFMKWYTAKSRKRFALSFNENLERLFQEDLDQVTTTSRLLSQQIQYYMSANVKVTKLIAEETSENVKTLLNMYEAGQRQSTIRETATADMVENMIQLRLQSSTEDLKDALKTMMDEFKARFLSEIAGKSITELLVQQASQTMLKEPESDSPGPGTIEGSVATDPKDGLDLQNITSAEVSTRQLEDYFDWLDVHPLDNHALSPLVETAFVTRLNTFTTTMEAQILYAHGRYRPEGFTLLQQSVGAYISLARDHGVHVVSHFCRPSTDEPPNGRTQEAIALCGLLYSLIRQISILIPTVQGLENGASIGEDISSLEGTLRTWKKALRLFAHVVENFPPPLLLIVIEGLNRLEDDIHHSTDEELVELVRCLIALVDRFRKGGRILKVLFCTAGLSEPLSQEVDEMDQLACDMAPQHIGRKPKRGRHRISY